MWNRTDHSGLTPQGQSTSTSFDRIGSSHAAQSAPPPMPVDVMIDAVAGKDRSSSFVVISALTVSGGFMGASVQRVAQAVSHWSSVARVRSLSLVRTGVAAAAAGRAGQGGQHMTTGDTEARAAVQQYLDAQFPDGDLWDDGDGARAAHTWSVEEHGVIMLLTVASEFLRDVPPENIVSLLSEWTIAELLRASGAAERLIVTTDGPHAEPR
jgi:hypothetical protein